MASDSKDNTTFHRVAAVSVMQTMLYFTAANGVEPPGEVMTISEAAPKMIGL